MECFAESYQYSLDEDLLDLTNRLYLNPGSNQGSTSSTASSPVFGHSPSPVFSYSPSSTSIPTVTWSEVNSLEYQFRQLLFKDISSPLNALDNIRFTEADDFLINGIDRELDEFDHYQGQLRCQPQNSYQTFVKEARHHHQPDEPMRNTVCVFCKNNGETLSVYGSHLLKDNSGKVTCPILRRYTCPICGTSGDTAHTVRYCPLRNSIC